MTAKKRCEALGWLRPMTSGERGRFSAIAERDGTKDPGYKYVTTSLVTYRWSNAPTGVGLVDFDYSGDRGQARGWWEGEAFIVDVSEAFHFDGPSGPMPDFLVALLAALIHDVLYQVHRSGLIGDAADPRAARVGDDGAVDATVKADCNLRIASDNLFGHIIRAESVNHRRPLGKILARWGAVGLWFTGWIAWMPQKVTT